MNLCIYIALAVAQKGNGHIAGMTGWGLFFNVEVLLHAAAFCEFMSEGRADCRRAAELSRSRVALQWRLRLCTIASQSLEGSPVSSGRSGQD